MMPLEYKRKKNSRADRIFIFTMICLPMLHFIVFSIYLNYNSFAMAFQDVDFATNEVVWVGFRHFKDFFVDFATHDTWRIAILNSVLYLPLTAVIMLPLSILAGYFLLRKVPLAGAYKVIFFLPSIISIVVLCIVFRNMFDYDGPVNYILTHWFHMDMNKIPAWLNSRGWTMGILCLYAVWAGLGYNIVLLYGAMSRVPQEVIESARLDGIGMFREIFQIYVPIIWPTVSTMIVFSVMTVFQQYMHPLVLTSGGGDSYTIAYLIIQEIKFGKYYSGAAMGLILAVVATPIVQLAKWIVNRIYDTVEV